jgi:hypothetical protein
MRSNCVASASPGTGTPTGEFKLDGASGHDTLQHERFRLVAGSDQDASVRGA